MNSGLKNAELLSLFGEEALSGDNTAAECQTGENTGLNGENDLQNAAQSAAPAAGEEDIEGEFAKLISKGGRFEAAFQKAMQKSFNKRYASLKRNEADIKSLGELRDAVAKRYGYADSGDIDALTAAVVSDGDVKNRVQLQVEKESAIRENAKNAAMDFYRRVRAEEAEMVKKYSGFDLTQELHNPRFRQALMTDGNTLEDAYWSVHRSELIKKTAEDAKNAAADRIAVRKYRPEEGATAAKLPSTSKVDYSNMSDREFLELYKRATGK